MKSFSLFLNVTILCLLSMVTYGAQVPPTVVTSAEGVCKYNHVSVSVEHDESIGTPPYTYVWSTGHTSASFSYYPGEQTTFTVTITDDLDAKFIASSTVNVSDIQILLPSEIVVPYGDSVDIPIEITSSYSHNTAHHTNIGGMRHIAGDIYRVGLKEKSGVFAVEVSDVYGCYANDETMIYSNIEGQLSIKSDSLYTFCEPSSYLKLFADDKTGYADVFKWYVNGKFIESRTKYDNPDFYYEYSYESEVVVIAENFDGIVLGADTVTISPSVNPSFTVALIDQSDVFVDEPFTERLFTSTATGTTSQLEYAWYPATKFDTVSLPIGQAKFTGSYEPVDCFVQAIDDKGCVSIDEFSIAPNLQNNIQLSTDSIHCDNVAEQRISAEVGDMNASVFLFEWFNGSTPIGMGREINYDLVGDVDLNLKVSYKGANVADTTVTLFERESPVATIIDPGVQSGVDTIISVEVTSGLPTYTYSWELGLIKSGEKTDSVEIFGITKPTQYTVTVTDARNCSDTASKIIAPLNGPLSGSIYVSKETPLCPMEEVMLSGSASGGASATSNQADYTFSWTSSPAGFTANTASIVVSADGYTVYYLTIDDGLNNPITIEYGLPIATDGADYESSFSNPSCHGLQDGVIEINTEGKGGMQEEVMYYSQVKFNGIVNNEPFIVKDNLNAGVYHIEVRQYDGMYNELIGCVFDTITLTAPEQILITSTTTDATPGIEDGTIEATVTKGGKNITDFTYSFDGGAPVNETFNVITIDGLASGTHTLEVTDATGCSEEAVIEVGEKTNLIVELVKQQDVLCFGDSTGVLELEVTNLFAGEVATFAWSNDSTTSSISGLKAGKYGVTVTGKNLAGDIETVIDTFRVFQPAVAYEYTIITRPETCDGDKDGGVELYVTNTEAMMQFIWSGGTSSSMADTLDNKEYTVLATDENNCVDTLVFEIGKDEAPYLDLGVDTTLCPDQTLELIVGSAKEEFYYDWHDGSTSNSYTALPGETVSVTVTDQKACVSTDIIEVYEIPYEPIEICQLDVLPDGAVSISIDDSRKEDIISYSIYRNNEVIANAFADNGFTYTDLDASANDASIGYSIVATDRCIQQLPISNNKYTAFLEVTSSTEGNSLSWITGSTTADEQKIYRGETPEDLTLLESLPIESSIFVDEQAPTKAYYQIAVMESTSCSDSLLSNIVYVSTLPIIEFTATPTLVGVGETVEFVSDVENAVGNVLWSFEGGDQPEVSALIVEQTYSTPGVYDVKLKAGNTNGEDSLLKEGYITVVGIETRDNSVCIGDSIVLTATDLSAEGYSYVWSTGETSQSIKIAPETTTDISVEIKKDVFNKFYDTVTVVVSTPIELGAPVALCEGESIEKTYDGYVSYIFNNGEELGNGTITLVPDSTFTVVATDAYGCVSKDTLIMAPFVETPNVALGADTVLCAGSELELSVPEEALDIKWNDTIFTTNYIVKESGEYKVEYSNGTCIGYDTIVVTVNETIAPEFAYVSVAEDGQGVVVWENGLQLQNVTVSVETNELDVYETVGTVAQADSNYISSQTYNLKNSIRKFRVTSVDTCDNFTDTLTFSSIHLNASPSNFGKNVVLTWTEPLGYEVATYYIYRGTSATNMTKIWEMAGGNYAYTDVTPIEGAQYVIAVELPSGAIPAEYQLGEWQGNLFTSNISKSGYTSKLPSIDFIADRNHVGVGTIVTITSQTTKAESVNWEFDGAEILSVSDTIAYVKYLEAGTYAVKQIASNVDGTDSLTKEEFITVGGVPVDSLVFFPHDTIKVGQNEMLKVFFYPFDAEDKSVQFESLDESILYVENGIVFGQSEGTALIVATKGDEPLTDTLELTVKGFVDAEDIVLPYALWMDVKDTLELNPVFVPFSLKKLPLEWSVSDTSIATINASGALVALDTGVVKVIGFDAISGIPVSVPVLITKAGEDAESIVIPETMEIAAEYAYNIPIAVAPLGMSAKDIVWTISDSEVVTVTADGVLQPLGEGEAYVVAQLGDVTDTCHLTILPSKCPELTIADTILLIAGIEKEIFVLNAIQDDNTPAELIEWDYILSENITAEVRNSILFLKADADFIGIQSVTLIAKDVNGLVDEATIVVNVIPNDTIAPVLSIPDIRLYKGTISKKMTLTDYITDNYSVETFISTDVSGDIKGVDLDESLNKLTITVDPDVDVFSSTFVVTAYDYNDNTATQTVSLSVSDEPNKAPRVLSLPNQMQETGEVFEAVSLKKYVQDDYTLPADMKWEVTGMKHMSARIIRNTLYVLAKDVTWTGSERLTVTATDEHGASTSKDVWYSQIASAPKSWQGLPEISFLASTVYTVPGRPVTFYGSVNGSDEMIWEFEGGAPNESSKLRPDVTYATQGIYSVSLSAQNEYGIETATKEDYITVVGINERSVAICSGDSETLTIDAEGFTSYKWSTGEETSSITVSPTTTTTYAVTISEGFAFVIDSVTVSVTNGLNLGEDQTLCEGHTLTLQAEGYKEYFWNGSTESGDSVLTVTEAREYTLHTTDDAGCNFYDTITVTEILPSPVVNLGTDLTFCYGEVAHIGTDVEGTYLWSTTAQVDSIVVDTTGIYTLTVTGANGCSGIDSISILTKVPFQQEIGVVTISESGHNLIAWERPATRENISKYRVYRESSVAGEFDMITEKAFDDLSVVVDTEVVPEQQAFTYSITVVDSCGNESAYSPTHRPIHLSYTLKPSGDVDLKWEAYKVGDGGTLPYKSYRIYRGTAADGLDEVATVNAGVFQFTDLNVPNTNKVFYRVAVVLDQDVTPETLKSDSGPFSQSMSNLAEAIIETSVADVFAGSVSVSPNPFQSQLTISASGEGLTEASYEIVSATGVVAMSANVELESDIAVTIETDNLPVGLYYVRLNTNIGVYTEKITKQ